MDEDFKRFLCTPAYMHKKKRGTRATSKASQSIQPYTVHLGNVRSDNGSRHGQSSEYCPVRKSKKSAGKKNERSSGPNGYRNGYC